MIIVKHNTETHEFDTLDQAMAWAKESGEFVTIQFNGSEVVGKFGAVSSQMVKSIDRKNREELKDNAFI
jgi:hypothetical protein